MPSDSAAIAAPPSAADRIVALADACVLCGLCLPHCPTYALDRVESESPRGRIMLFKGLAEGRLARDSTANRHLDHCLACRNCEAVCPAQVRYGELLSAGRQAQRQRIPAPWRQVAIEMLLARPRLLSLGLRLGSMLRGSLPGPWRRLPATPSRRACAAFHPSHGPARGRVGLFLGCLGSHHDAAAAQAAVGFLTRLGWDVAIPPAQGCCGAAHAHAGENRRLARLQAANRAAFSGAFDAVLTLASGCHETFAKSPAADTPVQEALAFIAADEQFDRLRFRPASTTQSVAVHLPCTQRNVTRSATAVLPLLQRIPGLNVDVLPASGCCGAAGSHLLTEPARADALREPTLAAIERSGAATLCSANVGCRLHLAVGCEQRGLSTQVRHPLELLADHLEPDPA